MMNYLFSGICIEQHVAYVVSNFIVHEYDVNVWCLMQDNLPSVLFAMAGGVVLSIGNLSTQYAWAFVGLSVVEVITSSITVVIGISHWHNQSKIVKLLNKLCKNYVIYTLQLDPVLNSDELTLFNLSQAQHWIIFWMTKSIKLRFFFQELVAFWLQFV